MYAIVDIETTGGNTTFGRITEIAIILHDGEKILKKYHSLINPHCRIPYHITKLTNITNEMVSHAPSFYEIARDIVEFTEGAVFVAHNVRFDYGFIRAAFKNLGYDYVRPVLCTVKLSREVFTNLDSYSLGNLCSALDIPIQDQHRAMGDAEATTVLFERIMQADGNIISNSLLPRESRKLMLPPLLKKEAFESIPHQTTGVYYFYNASGDVIYVGKSKDIKKRLMQHFSSQHLKKSIRMLHEIANISFEATGSELLALLLESTEIKNLKPAYNVAQKRTRSVNYYGIFRKLDKKGYLNLYMKRIRKGEEPLLATESFQHAQNVLERLVEKFNLCLAKTGIEKTDSACFDFKLHKCSGACIGDESKIEYNARAAKAIKSFSFETESFFLIDDGRKEMEKSVVCIEKGKYRGFGFCDFSFSHPSIDDLFDCIKPYDHNRNIQQILCSYEKKGLKKFPFQSGQLELFDDITSKVSFKKE